MSLFEGLSIGNRGLNASQLAINVTGQNISNANTEGYSRKRLQLAADSRKDGTFGQFGFGVDVVSIERVRNVFLDKQITVQNSAHAHQEQLDYALERIENIFHEPSDTGLNSMLDQFWSSWQDVANNPGDLSSREALRTTTTVMVEQFHALSTELRDHKVSMNDNLRLHVDAVNTITTEISRLNQAIIRAESGEAQAANDSRDRRDMLLKELSGYMQIDYVEDSLGAITVTTSGNILVSPQRSFQLELYQETVVTSDGSQFSSASMRFANTKDPYIPKSGSLKGILQIRDEIIPAYEQRLDAMAATLVQEINAVHYEGYNLDRGTGVHFFDPEFERASTIKLSAAVEQNVNKIAAAVGGQITQPAGAPVIAALDAGYPATSMDIDLKTIDPRYNSLAEGTVAVYQQPGGELLREGPDGDYIVDYENGVLRFHNTARFAGGDTFEVDFRYNTTGFGGRGDGENALRIAQIRDKATMVLNSDGTHTHSIGEFYSSFIGVLGVERNEAVASRETRKYLLTQLEAQQQAIAGVSLDEEMANMIRFEHTFQASARFLRSINDMLDVLMNI